MGFKINQTIDLLKPDRIEQNAGSIAYTGDFAAHTWEITLQNATGFTTGKTASALFVLPSGLKVLQSATISGNVVTITFSAAAYAEVGAAIAFMRLVDDDSETTIAYLRYIVTDCATGEIHIPDDVVIPAKELTQKYNQLLTQYGTLALNATKLSNIAGALSIDTTNKVLSMGNGYTIGNYSTTEHNTGSTWIDGKAIYSITFSWSGNAQGAVNNVIGYMPNGYDTIVKLDHIIKKSNGEWNGSFYYNQSNNAYMSVWNSDRRINLWTNSALNGITVLVTVYYTKQ